MPPAAQASTDTLKGLDYGSLLRFMNLEYRVQRPQQPTQIVELLVVVTPGPSAPDAPKIVPWPNREVWRTVEPGNRSAERGIVYSLARTEDQRYAEELQARKERCRLHVRDTWLSEAAVDPRLTRAIDEGTAARYAVMEAGTLSPLLARLQEQEAFYRVQLGRPNQRAEDRSHFARGLQALRTAVADTQHNQRVLEARRDASHRQTLALVNGINAGLRDQLDRWLSQPAEAIDAAELIRLYRQLAVLTPEGSRAATCMPELLQTQVRALQREFVAYASGRVMPRFRAAVLAAAPRAQSSRQLRGSMAMFGRQDALNDAFVNDDPAFRDQMAQHIAAMEAREAEEIRQRRRDLIAMRLRDNPSPDAAALTKAWTRLSLRRAQELHRGQEGAVMAALPFLDMLMGGRFEESGDDSYCYMRNTLRGSWCQHRIAITVTSPSCSRTGRQHRCRFKVTYSGEADRGVEEALVSWNAEGELDVAPGAKPMFMSVQWVRSGSSSSAGGRGQNMADILMERDVDNRMNYENRQRETTRPGQRWEAYDPARRY
jgi:hypothetical protein